MDSILSSIKKELGIVDEMDVFDPQVIMAINTAFGILNELGVGPDDGFRIYDYNTVWSDFIPEGALQDMVKTYVYLEASEIFDPTSNSVLSGTKRNMINELKWRITNHK